MVGFTEDCFLSYILSAAQVKFQCLQNDIPSEILNASIIYPAFMSIKNGAFGKLLSSKPPKHCVGL